MSKKPLDIPFHVLDNVQDPPTKPGGHRRMIDLDQLAVVPDNARVLIEYNQKTYTTTKAQLIGSLGKIYLTESALLSPAVEGVIEYADGHLYFTQGDRYTLVGSNGIKITTTTVANTIVETVIYTHTFAANTFHADMRVITAIAGAFSADSAAESLTIRFKLGGATIHTISVTPTNAVDVGWRAVHEGTIRTDGAAGTYVDFSEFSESGVSSIYAADLTPHVIDTTSSFLYEITVEWGAAKAGNSFTCTQGDLTYKH